MEIINLAVKEKSQKYSIKNIHKLNSTNSIYFYKPNTTTINIVDNYQVKHSYYS